VAEGKKEVKGKAFDAKTAKRIFTYVRPYKTKFFFCVGIVIVLAGLSISRPLIIQKTINDYVVGNDPYMLKMMTILLIGIVFTEAILQLVNMTTAGFLGTSIVKDLRLQVFKHILKMRNKYFDNSPVGTLVTRSVSDIESLGDVFSEGFIIIFGDILMLVVFSITMLIIDWKLTLLAMTTVPLLIFATNIFKNGVRVSFNAVRNAVAALNTFVQEHITGMKIVQVFTREEEEYEKFKAINETHKKANVQSIWYYSVFFPIVEILSSVSIGLVIFAGGFGKYVKEGDFIFFIMLIHMFFRPVRLLADRINTLQMGMVASDRVFKVLDTNEEISSDGNIKSDHIKGEIEFRNVWFAYNEEDWVLRDVSFKVRSGETLAIVGATGAGKSTIINLVGRYYEFNKGEILLDGINIREYDLAELRTTVGVVLQDVFLFSDSIENNIALYNEKITREQIIEGAKKISTYDFLNSLPGGLDYNPGERGVTLSAGQRQIISFLRAYVHNPAVLILDEATSNIDTETEILIQRATDLITLGRTSIIIAHRLSTIQKADRILVMDQGKVIEEGNLDQLLQMRGNFKKLYDLQFS
jgi:ATP-binding cassette, subfamily B, multidrug efflux pump